MICISSFLIEIIYFYKIHVKKISLMYEKNHYRYLLKRISKKMEQKKSYF